MLKSHFPNCPCYTRFYPVWTGLNRFYLPPTSTQVNPDILCAKKFTVYTKNLITVQKWWFFHKKRNKNLIHVQKSTFTHFKQLLPTFYGFNTPLFKLGRVHSKLFKLIQSCSRCIDFFYDYINYITRSPSTGLPGLLTSDLGCDF